MTGHQVGHVRRGAFVRVGSIPMHPVHVLLIQIGRVAPARVYVGPSDGLIFGVGIIIGVHGGSRRRRVVGRMGVMLWICRGHLLVVVMRICLALPIHSVSTVGAHHGHGVITSGLLVLAVGVATLGRAVIVRICSIEGRLVVLVIIIVGYGTCVKMSILIAFLFAGVFVILRCLLIVHDHARSDRSGYHILTHPRIISSVLVNFFSLLACDRTNERRLLEAVCIFPCWLCRLSLIHRI